MHYWSRIKLYFWQKQNPLLPWITRGAVQFLDQYLSKTDVMLETGSGRSTAWFAQKVKKVYSIEHHVGWYEKVKSDLLVKGINNVEYFNEDNTFTVSPSDSPYVQKVAQFEHQYFDVILMDGKHRGEIALLALEKIKPGGIIIIDNIERELVLDVSAVDRIDKQEKIRPTFVEFSKKTETYRKIIFQDGVTVTMVVFVP